RWISDSGRVLIIPTKSTDMSATFPGERRTSGGADDDVVLGGVDATTEDVAQVPLQRLVMAETVVADERDRLLHSGDRRSGTQRLGTRCLADSVGVTVVDPR